MGLALYRIGYKPIGIRLDSGDLSYLSKECRKIFLEFSETTNIKEFSTLKIVASNDLDEATILSLNQQGHAIDAFGIGTNLVTCKTQPALGCVYKLVEIRGEARIKISQDVSKMSLPCRKDVYRIWGANPYPVIDIMLTCDETAPEIGKKILCLHPFDQKKRAYVTPSKVEKLHHLYWDGKVRESLPSLEELRNYVISQLKEMRPDHLYMNLIFLKK